MKKAFLLTVAFAWCVMGSAWAQFDSGSDGSDGLFDPETSVTIDLSQANTVPPGDPAYNPGQGYYDPDLWVVVFNYTTINIRSGVTVSFTPHPSGAPVAWLTTGDVNIQGLATVSGASGLGQSTGANRQYSRSGPGGFWGSVGGTHAGNGGMWPAGGMGPGGSTVDSDGDGAGTGGSYASQGAAGGSSSGIVRSTYGNSFIIPLLGGSGGSGGWGTTSNFGGNGGSGAGAILIASSGIITLPPAANTITANGGTGGATTNCTGIDAGGGGSGGAIRLMANTITGAGRLRASGGGGGGGATGCGGSQNGGTGGSGRIRVEADLIELTNPGSPNWTSANEPGLVFQAVNWPKLRATMLTAQDSGGSPIGGAVPAEPDYDPASVELVLNDLINPATLQILAENVPPGTAVDVHVVPKNGTAALNTYTVSSGALVGTMTSSTAEAIVNLPVGTSEVQLQATWAAPRGDTGFAPGSLKRPHKDLPRYRRVNAIVGVEMGPGPDMVTYTTGDGRRVTYPIGLIENATRTLQRVRSR